MTCENRGIIILGDDIDTEDILIKSKKSKVAFIGMSITTIILLILAVIIFFVKINILAVILCVVSGVEVLWFMLWSSFSERDETKILHNGIEGELEINDGNIEFRVTKGDKNIYEDLVGEDGIINIDITEMLKTSDENIETKIDERTNMIDIKMADVSININGEVQNITMRLYAVCNELYKILVANGIKIKRYNKSVFSILKTNKQKQ